MAMAPGSAAQGPPRGPVPGPALLHATPPSSSSSLPSQSQLAEPRSVGREGEDGGGAGGGGEGGGREDAIVWIANPCEGKPQVPVERWRVLERGFEEEALDVLWDTRGAYVSYYEACFFQRTRRGKLKTMLFVLFHNQTFLVFFGIM